ncbi:MazG nucleotide pyrophosphohydrolase domain-containing protein [Desulfotalea psychrophila]|uniref:NTP pyrophosphohydrolase MazG-like domain-containing protein n=1 Tax=Desulfotalea psychrophila (strain LSv54 / DSM 12343) TaxID=177439 RepID=Q6AK03_DESPS|nr:MazG nucleotide pyrophosphohydrolase domain-containing protein [Desulfotalea psychrophila]CAG37323.1 conserved hypothetical protein [Desulfotalea psychrophila LSv54]
MSIKTKQTFTELLETIKQLLGEEGCPWDKKQTNESIIKYLKSESQELIDALEKKDYPNICEELGDVLYIVILISSINKKEGQFSLEDVFREVNAKLVRRHPHVFAGTSYETEEDLAKQWEKIKQQEKHDAKIQIAPTNNNKGNIK